MKGSFLDKFESFFCQHSLIMPDETIVAGFSGGCDSTALMLSLYYFKTKYRLRVVAVHINYGLRGLDSDADENFVKEFCFERSIPLVVEHASLTGSSDLENRARRIRFTALQKTAAAYNANRIALGHNMGDQAETVLFRLCRGSGFSGLKGISPKRGKIIHPLLPFSRAEIESFVMNNNLVFRHDLSNDTALFTRNKIRNELVPWLQTNINPNLVSRLCENAEIFREAEAVLKNLALQRYRAAVTQELEGVMALSLPRVLKSAGVLRYYIYRQAYKVLRGTDKDFYLSHYRELEKILTPEGSKTLTLPGNIEVYKEYDELIFTLPRPACDPNARLELSAPRARVEFEGAHLAMKKLKKLPEKPFHDENRVFLDFSSIVWPLVLRHRQHGDRFMPLGMDKSKKLKDFFIDEKVPRFDRDRVIIVADAEKILWVAGHRLDQRVRVTAQSKNILELSLELGARKRSARRKTAKAGEDAK